MSVSGGIDVRPCTDTVDTDTTASDGCGGGDGSGGRGDGGRVESEPSQFARA